MKQVENLQERDLSYYKKFESKYFKLEEFLRSETAEKHGIENIPELWNILGLNMLCKQTLDPLREEYGGPISITSGYRNPQLNKMVGGSYTSQHMGGTAADIVGENPEQTAILAAILGGHPTMRFDQMIIHGWDLSGDKPRASYVHVSASAKDRYQIIIDDIHHKKERINAEIFTAQYLPYFPQLNY